MPPTTRFNQNNTINAENINNSNISNIKIYEIKDEFLLNLSDTETRRFIKISLSLGYAEDNSKLQTELEEKLPVIKEILDKLNNNLKSGKILDLYFTNLLIQ